MELFWSGDTEYQWGSILNYESVSGQWLLYYKRSSHKSPQKVEYFLKWPPPSFMQYLLTQARWGLIRYNAEDAYPLR